MLVHISQIKGLLESFKKSTHMTYGGGIGLAYALLEGGSAKCVHMRAEGGRGSKKAKKLRAHYMDGPKAIFPFTSFKRLR